MCFPTNYSVAPYRHKPIQTKEVRLIVTKEKIHNEYGKFSWLLLEVIIKNKINFSEQQYIKG